MSFDLETATPITTNPGDGAQVFGATSESATAPSVFGFLSLWAYIASKIESDLFRGLADDTETIAGVADDLAVTPAGLSAALAGYLSRSGAVTAGHVARWTSNTQVESAGFAATDIVRLSQPNTFAQFNTFSGPTRLDGTIGVGRNGSAAGGIYFNRDPDNPFLLFSAGPSATPTDIAQLRASLGTGVIGFTNWSGGVWGVAYNPTTNTVGIGTSSPPAKLSVSGTGNTNTDYADGDSLGAALRVADTGGAGGNGGQILFAANQGVFAGIKGTMTNGAGPAGALHFQTRTTSGNVVSRMMIAHTGSVGVLTQSPSTTLHVNGPIRCGSYTVATLPSAATVGAGTRAHVTDATATTFASTVAGGGTNNVPVYSDGAAWKIG